MRIGAVVPAAGEGRRLGRPKALARIAGEAFVTRVARQAAEAASDVVVVLGAAGKDAEALVPAPARTVHHESWSAGRTGSVKAGLKALGDVDAFLVWPVDVPLASADDARALVRAYVPGRAAVAVHDKRRGHPVLLPGSHREAVMKLGDDDPLHLVVRAADPVEVETGNEGVLLDVDRPEDLARAEALAEGSRP